MKSILRTLLAAAIVAAPFPAWSQVGRLPGELIGSGTSSPYGSVAAAPSALSVPTLGGALAPLNAPAALSAAPALSFSASPAASLPVVAAAPAPLAAAAAPAAANFPADASVRGKTFIMVGTKSSRPFIMLEAARVAKELGLNLVLVDDPANRANSAELVPDSHFIAAPINTRDEKTMDRIAEAVAAHPLGAKASAVTGFMSLYATLAARVTERLGASGISPKAVAAADHKPLARKLLNAADPAHAVPYAEIASAEEARAAYRAASEDGRYKVMLKTSRGENSRFLALNLDSEDAAAKAFAQMDAEVNAFVARPEAAQTTFSSHPGIMMERMLEKLPGTEETSAEVVMQDGKPAFAIVSDTQGIGRNKELAGGILVFPSQQPESAHREIIEASGRALKAIGIENGSARLDLMMTKDGPRIIEINPLMGSVAIWEVVRSLTGVSLVEQGLRAMLGLRVDPGHAPDGVAHYVFLAAGESGTLEAVEGVDEARKADGVVNARSFVEPGDTIAAAGKATYEEWGEVIGKGKSWAEAIGNAIAGAGRMILRVRRGDATPVAVRATVLPEAAGRSVAEMKAYLRSRYDLGGAAMRYIYNTDSFRGMLTIYFDDRAALKRAAVPAEFKMADGTTVTVSSELTPEAREAELQAFKDDVRLQYSLGEAGLSYRYNSDNGRRYLTISFADRAALDFSKVPSELRLPSGARVEIISKLTSEGAARELSDFLKDLRARYRLGDADMNYRFNTDSWRGMLDISFSDRAALERSAVPNELRMLDGTRVTITSKLTPEGREREGARFMDDVRTRYSLGDAGMKLHNPEFGRSYLQITFPDRAAMQKASLPETLHMPDGSLVRMTGDYLQPTASDFGLAPVAAPAAPAADAAPGLFSKAVLGFLSTFVLVSTVVESTSLAVSQMTQPLSQGFMALAALTSVSYAAYTLGSFFGGSVIKRLGINVSYRAVLAVRALIWTAIALLFNPATGTIALAALIPLFSLDYFFHSIGRVAEHSLQVAWFQNSEVKSSRFGSFRDFIEYGSVFVGSAMALAVAKFGFGAVIYPAAPAFAAAALIALALKLPKAAPDRKPGKWSDGFKTVFRDARIWKPLAGFALVNSFLYMMYYITATAFGAYAAPDPQHAAGVAGSLTAVYGAGALIGSVVMDRMAAAIDKKAQALPEGVRKEGERALYVKSAAKVLPWAAAALLGSWLFTLPVQIGTLIWPIFPVSVALLAIGFTAQMASNHLDVIMKSHIPKGEKDMAVGAIRTLTYATHVAGFIVWGGLFALFGPHAFFLFAAFYTAAAGAYLWLARSLRK